MRLIHDDVAILTANTNSSTANSTPVTIDHLNNISVMSTITDSTPAATTAVSGVKEVTTITNIGELGVKEVTTIQTLAASAITSGQYFTIKSALDAISYYCWLNKDAGGGDPAPGGTAIEVAIVAADTATQVAVKVAAALDALAAFGVPVPGTDTMTVTHASTGVTTDAVDVDSGSTVTVTTQGVTSTLNGKYFNISTALDAILNYVWFSTDGTEGTDPAPGGGRVGVKISTTVGDTATQVAVKVSAALDALAGYASPAPGTPDSVVTNASTGATTSAANVDVGAGFSIAITTAGVTSFLNSKYFTIYSELDAIAYYVWFSTNSEGVDPAPASKTAIPVTTAIGDTANTVADSVAAALDALAAFSAPNPGAAVVTCTNAKTGATTNVANVDVGTGFSVATTVAGVTSFLNGKYFTINTAIGYPTATIAHYVWFSTNSEGTDPAPAGKTGIAVATTVGDTATQVATAVSAAIDALAGYVCPDTAAPTSVVTNFDAGLTTDAANVDVGTGFSIAITTPGTASFVDLINDYVKIVAHGYLTGLKGQLTTTSALPTGLSLSTDYYVIVVDDDTIQLATTLANAVAGTQIDITAIGVGTHTFTATAALAGSLIIQGSNDNVTYATPVGSQYTISYTAAGSHLFNLPDLSFKWVRLQDSVTSGQSTVTSSITTKSETINP